MHCLFVKGLDMSTYEVGTFLQHFSNFGQMPFLISPTTHTNDCRTRAQVHGVKVQHCEVY